MLSAIIQQQVELLCPSSQTSLKLVRTDSAKSKHGKRLLGSCFVIHSIPFHYFFTEFSKGEHVIYIKLDDVAPLRIYVGDVPTWKNPQNAWRSDSRFNLTSVPMLIRWENDTIEGRQDDNEAYIEDKIQALIA
ncbi:hypothetical protein QN277_011735 [Acacia crassicarpa]|uniref:Thioredoxin domain-containing protein n=1 Tax=Acacia crassicarpa TaxID=499986 RepID=A0AAE1MZM7_9FABA|nr:hypothetical protein QN277_011735 [Acacia crassicarpa]